MPWNRPKTPPIALGVPDAEESLHSQNQPTKEISQGPEGSLKIAPEVGRDDGDVKMEPKNLWNEAFLSLKPAEQARLKAILGDGQDSIFTKPDFESLKGSLQEKQDQCEEESWKITVGDHVLIVRDFAAKSATWLQQLGDIIIPFAPQAASAPWGLIRGVLQIPVSYDQQMLALLTTVDEVLKVVYRGQLFEMLYSPEKVHGDVLQTLHTELQGIYKSALELIAHTQKQLSHRTAKNAFEAIVNPDSADGVLSDLEARHIKLISAAQLCEGFRSAEADRRLTDAMRAIHEPLIRFEAKCETYFKELESTRRIETLEAISRIPYTSHHQEYQEKRTPKTCTWLLEDDLFRTWKNSSSPGVFWLWGNRAFYTLPIAYKIVRLILH